MLALLWWARCLGWEGEVQPVHWWQQHWARSSSSRTPAVEVDRVQVEAVRHGRRHGWMITMVVVQHQETMPWICMIDLWGLGMFVAPCACWRVWHLGPLFAWYISDCSLTAVCNLDYVLRVLFCICRYIKPFCLHGPIRQSRLWERLFKRRFIYKWTYLLTCTSNENSATKTIAIVVISADSFYRYYRLSDYRVFTLSS